MHFLNISFAFHHSFYLYLHLILSFFFLKKILKHLYLNILKMSIQTCRWTGPPIHIVLVLCFVTVLCHIVNRSYMLNTVQHSYILTWSKFFFEQTKKKPNRDEILNKAQLCVTKLFTLFQFSPQKCLK